jgi:hypothetical protein
VIKKPQQGTEVPLLYFAEVACRRREDERLFHTMLGLQSVPHATTGRDTSDVRQENVEAIQQTRNKTNVQAITSPK